MGNRTMRTDLIRSEVQQMVRRTPFQPFALSMENGDRIIIEHPENIAFDPDAPQDGKDQEFYVISKKLRTFSTFNAVTSISKLDTAEV